MVDWEKFGSKTMKLINTIQLTPLSKLGIGTAICFEFLTTTETKVKKYDACYYGKAKFDWKLFLVGIDSEDMLMRLKPVEYCQMVCNKIGYYLKLVRKVDLIRFSVEFQQD